jgi:hypothetical protein
MNIKKKLSPILIFCSVSVTLFTRALAVRRGFKICIFTVLSFISSLAFSDSYQTVTTSFAPSKISIGQTSYLTATYQASGNAKLAGLGLRLHYDSSELEMGGYTDRLSEGVLSFKIKDDTANYDDDTKTDKYFLTAWVDTSEEWPTGSTGPTVLYRVPFTALSDFDGSQVNLTASSTATGYVVRHNPSRGVLDIDGDGYYEPLMDGLLVLKYLFGLSGDSLISGLVSPDAVRTTAPEVENYLNSIVGNLDLDGDGYEDSLTDGLLVLRYLFGLGGDKLISGVLASDATRTSPAEIESYLGSLTSTNELKLLSESDLPFQSATGSNSPIIAMGQTTTITMVYQVEENAKLAGLGLRLHYDSSELELGDVTDRFRQGAQPFQIIDDVFNYDNDTNTDKYFLTSWAEMYGWPEVSTQPITLYKVPFIVLSDFDGTNINFTSSGVAAGYRFSGSTIPLFLDLDGDGVGDSADVFPNDASETTDSDSDGVGDNSDAFPLDSTETVDTDGDGIGNNTDTDDDGDEVLDSQDPFPLDASESVDTDGDGIGNNTDTDDDGDGVLDSDDLYPLISLDGLLDTDSDGSPNDCNSACVSAGMTADTDDDGDGVLDSQDPFPLDASESVDTDGDGIGNNTDTDDDGDGVLDSQDAFPLDASESVDTDGDGIGNNTDSDDDGDGVSDQQDAFPLKNTETKDSDGDGIGDNDEERAELIASDILSQKMISYAGSVAASFIDDIEDDYAGESDDWTLARGESVSLSISCSNGGGYDATVTRSDWKVLTIAMNLENCIDQNFMTTNGSATVTYDDGLWDQPTPRVEHPFVFSFTSLRIHDTVGKTFSYTGSLYCDSHYNSVAESWTLRNEGDSLVYERRWGSVFDEVGLVDWNINNSLIVDESGNTNFYITRYVPNCDFKNVGVVEDGKNHNILDVQYISQSNGSGFMISEDTRSEKLEKVQNKEVFIKDRYTDETGWIFEVYSPYGNNSSVRLAEKGEYSVNVYSANIPTYYWARRENVGDIVAQGILQFSEFEWVYLDATTDTIFSINYQRDWNSIWDMDNDGITNVISEPWVVSRFYSASQCNRFLRFGDWTVVDQATKSDDPLDPCKFNTGFDVYAGEIWYQDENMDGINELFTLDDDQDGILDADDNCQSIFNSDQLNTDNDSLGNACDKDDDGDGVPDSNDAFPLDSLESIDTDGDGVGNNSDWAPYNSTESVDTDGDGVGNNTDAFPYDATEILDMDGDGIGDNSDSDIDGDGALNGNDPYPLNGEYSADTDNDGMPDEWETRYGLDPNDPSDATSDQDNDGITALNEFLAGTIPSGSLDIDGNENYDALTDGLLLLRGMFGLDGSALVTGTVASDASYTEPVDIESRIATLGDLADIDGNGQIDALTDGLLTLRYLFGLQGDTLINGVVAGDATRKTAEEIEAHLETLMPAL